MGDTNYFSGIVKVLESPKYKIIKSNISTLTFRAELPQFRKTKLIHVVVWGNLVNDVKTYYQINDYILIEGYLLNKKKKIIPKNSKKTLITVLRIYPFILKSN